MDPSQAIDALTKVLPSGQLIIQGTQEYDDLNGSYQSIRSSETQPAAIFRPKSADEVSTFVRTIRPFAISGQAPFLLLLTYWSNANDDDAILGAMKTALRGIDQDATSKGTKADYVYMNYASEDQDVIKSYGGENKKFLQEASKKYDPEGLFQKGVPGGWKLFT